MSDLTPLEVATGVVLGQRDHPRVHVRRRPAPDPLAAFERALLPALSRPPCVVSFSGGMDSSFVLAVAARLARRKSLAAPIPVTWRFTGAPRAEESDWQDRVVAALDLPDWTVLRADDDLDLVGPVARRLLLRHGVLHPPNVHLHLPIAEAAAGGALLTGAGGDQVLAGWQRPTRRRQVRRAVRRLVRPAEPDPFPWLPAADSARVRRGYQAERRAEPRSAGARIRWHAGRRDLLTTCTALATVAAVADVVVINPLLDPGFVGALAAGLRHARPPSRADLLAGMAAGTLPPVVTAPRRKARLLEVFLRTPTREFTAGWDGTGVDPAVVDIDALRELWSHWPIPPATAGLVQQAWLAATPALLTKGYR